MDTVKRSEYCPDFTAEDSGEVESLLMTSSLLPLEAAEEKALAIAAQRTDSHTHSSDAMGAKVNF